MSKLALLARLKARPGKEGEVEALLTGAQALAQAEAGTRSWYAFKLDASTFGIFDTFDDEAGRSAHLSGEIAKALMDRAGELLAEPAQIYKLDVLASK